MKIVLYTRTDTLNYCANYPSYQPQSSLLFSCPTIESQQEASHPDSDSEAQPPDLPPPSPPPPQLPDNQGQDQQTANLFKIL